MIEYDSDVVREVAKIRGGLQREANKMHAAAIRERNVARAAGMHALVEAIDAAVAMLRRPFHPPCGPLSTCSPIVPADPSLEEEAKRIAGGLRCSMASYRGQAAIDTLALSFRVSASRLAETLERATALFVEPPPESVPDAN